jgi:hypothetical protein
MPFVALKALTDMKNKTLLIQISFHVQEKKAYFILLQKPGLLANTTAEMIFHSLICPEIHL